ncbi:NmrA-like protein 2 [Elsinoe fawcettii]|nr:NmrA-like protein 2 [Elsinoe fawcettii]
MTILVTGSTGKIGSALIKALRDSSHPFVAATRQTPPPASLSGVPTVHFVWDDESTWTAPFDSHKISAVFLLSPTVANPGPVVAKFASLAASRSVKRFVYMAGASATKDSGLFSEVWTRLDELKAEHGITYGLVSPCWVNENFLDARYVAEIKAGKIVSGMGDGKAPWNATRDIAGVSLWALTAEEVRENTIVSSRERITGDEIAATFTKVLGRKVEHVKKSKEENIEYLKSLGNSEGLAGLVGWIEGHVADGRTEHVPYQDVHEILGRPTIKFEEWVEENKAAWL